MFCPKCGSMLLPKKVNGKNVIACSTHGPVDSSVKLVQKSDSKLKDVSVVSEMRETHPITREECPKCKNEKAYFWTVQTRSIDESPTKYFKCTKCSHQWKSYD